ncbi:MAG: hypothetical protein MUF32_03310 [Burkholderiaceae bacterium]|nr:hypothetical protein [Burkholderiaceae bacterium]
MKRIVILGQPGAFGDAWCRRTALRLSQWLDVPLLSDADLALAERTTTGWVATATVDAFSRAPLHAADTAIWLNFMPLAVTREWLRGLRARFVGSMRAAHAPRLPDLRHSLTHLAWTPHVHRLLRHPAMAHLQVFHLRSPGETDFWLRAQEHRLPSRQPAIAQPA